MQGVFEFYRDLPVRPERPERLFFGLFPDAKTSVRVERFGKRFIREHHLEGMRLKTERLHVSLHHVGDYRRLRTRFIYAARLAGNAVSMHPFEMTFRCIGSLEDASWIKGRSCRRPLVLLGEGDAFVELRKSLGGAMEKSGLRAAENFTPHMTLLYGPKRMPVQAIEPIRFVVNEFVLIHSELSLTQYNVIDRWSLEGGQRGVG